MTDKQLDRVRRICLALPNTSEKLSHGAPTFWAGKRTFASYWKNHHNDGHIALLLPAEPGEQERLIRSDSVTYYRPPYVGPAGWVGINLDQIDDDELGLHVLEAYRLIMKKQSRKREPIQ
jgi:hypothetical protein